MKSFAAQSGDRERQTSSLKNALRKGWFVNMNLGDQLTNVGPTSVHLSVQSPTRESGTCRCPMGIVVVGYWTSSLEMARL